MNILMSPISSEPNPHTEIPMEQPTTPVAPTAPVVVATPPATAPAATPVVAPVAAKPAIVAAPVKPTATPPVQPIKQPIRQPIVAPTVAVQPPAEPEVVAAPEPTQPPLILPIEVSAKVMELIQRIRAISPALLIGLMGLLTYIKSMSPGQPLEEQVGARHQARLYEALKSLISTPTANFNLVWGTALAIIEEHSEGAFDWNYAFRFLESVTMSYPDVKALETLISLVTQTCSVEKRAEMAKGHLEQAKPLQRLTGSLGAENVQKLRTFYRLS